jgi:hypothetical protein
VPAEVSLVTRRGEVRCCIGKFPWGPQDPPSEPDCLAKFRECASLGAAPMTMGQMSIMQERVKRLEDLEMARFFDGVVS